MHTVYKEMTVQTFMCQMFQTLSTLAFIRVTQTYSMLAFTATQTYSTLAFTANKHGPACPLSQTQIRPHLTQAQLNYMILLLLFQISVKFLTNCVPLYRGD